MTEAHVEGAKMRLGLQLRTGRGTRLRASCISACVAVAVLASFSGAKADTLSTTRQLIGTGTVSAPSSESSPACPTSPAASAPQPLCGPATNKCVSNPSSKNCDNTDPSSTGCATNDSNTYTVASKQIFGTVHGYGGTFTNAYLGLVELRYSKICQTNWSRVTAQPLDCCYNPTAYAARVYREAGHGLAAKYSDKAYCYADYCSGGTHINATLYSNQLYAPHNRANAYGEMSGIDPCNCGKRVYFYEWTGLH